MSSQDENGQSEIKKNMLIHIFWLLFVNAKSVTITESLLDFTGRQACLKMCHLVSQSSPAVEQASWSELAILGSGLAQ